MEEKNLNLKYTDIRVTFAEIPDEISLCINISNCPCLCKNCHSSYLAKDIGIILTTAEVEKLINISNGISCIAFMGGDISPTIVNTLAKYVKEEYPKLKVAWYSGRQELSKDIDLQNFNFIKLGPYNEDLGPLDSRTTNQRYYEVKKNELGNYYLEDNTYKFWR